MTDASGMWDVLARLARRVRAGGGGEGDDDRGPKRSDCARTVHLMANALAFVPRPSMRAEVVASIRAIFDAPDRAEAQRQLGLAVKRYQAKAPRLAEWLDSFRQSRCDQSART